MEDGELELGLKEELTAPAVIMGLSLYILMIEVY